jgi:sigma54-dependent transcription regulator
LRILRKNKGYLIYQDNVVEIQYGENVEQMLLKAVEEVRRLRNFVSSSSLNDIIDKFKRDYERFRQRFGIEPLELLEVLKNEGLA